IDLNHIKEINEEFGHAAGDRMLLKVARVFRDKLGDQVLLARFGGDEFAVLLSNVSETKLQVAAEDLQNSLKENAFSEGGKTFNFVCNFGTALIGTTAADAQKLLSDVYRAAQTTAAPAAAAAPKKIAAPTAAEPPARSVVPAAAPAKEEPKLTPA